MAKSKKTAKSKKPSSHATLVETGKILKKSKVKNPCQACWEIFSDHKTRLGAAMRRKDAIDDCLKQGIAFYTARTQYQAWKQAGDNDTKAALIHSRP